MRSNNSFASLIFVINVVIGGGIAFATNTPTQHTISFIIGGASFLVAVVACLSIRVADQWDSVWERFAFPRSILLTADHRADEDRKSTAFGLIPQTSMK